MNSLLLALMIAASDAPPADLPACPTAEETPNVVPLIQRTERVLEQRFYDEDNVLARRMTYGELKKVGWRTFPMKLTIFPADKGRQTIGVGITSSGYYDLSVTYNGVAQSLVRVAVNKENATPPSGGGGANKNKKAGNSPAELYRLDDDLAESKNLAAQHLDKVQELTSRLAALCDAARTRP